MTEYSETPAISKNSRIADLWKERHLAFRIGTDHLWLVAIFACFIFLASLMPLFPNDFWWHLKVGEIIFAEGRIPSTNMFAWSIPGDHPYTYGAWLSEYLFYLFYKIGRVELVLFVRNVMAAITFGLAAYEAKRRSGSWRMAALAVALAWPMIFNNLAVRPQILSWLPFIAFFMILSRYVEGQLSKRWLFLLPLLMLYWVNVHGAFVLGVMLIGAYFAGEALSRLLRLPGAIPWERIRWLGIIGLLTCLAILVNPQGPGVFGYVTDLMTDPPSQALIDEWRSPTPQGISNLTFFVSILLLLAGLAYSRYRPRASEILLISGLLWLAWSGQRYIIWYALVVTPILAGIFANLPIKYPRLNARKNRLNLILAAGLLLPALLVQPWFVKNYPLPKLYGDLLMSDSQAGPLLSRRNPVEAVDYLREKPGGRLFNELGYGSFLIWALPGRSVFIDPRVELYPYDQLRDYVYISHGLGYNQLLEKYGVDRILLDKELQPELAEALASDPSWIKEYEDQRAQIWDKK